MDGLIKRNRLIAAKECLVQMENVITKLKSCGGRGLYSFTLIGGLSSPYFDRTTWSYYKFP